MKRSQLALLMVFGGAGLASVFASGCSSDDAGDLGSGGTAGATAGSSGKGGSAANGGGAAGKGGTTGRGGTGTVAGSGGMNVAGEETGGTGGTAGGTGGAAGGTGGTAGGTGGAAGGTGGASGGSAGSGGKGGSGGLGVAGESDFGGEANGGEGGAAPCGPGLDRPSVPPGIRVADSAVLVAAFSAEGTQNYTCTASTTTPTTYAWSAAVPAADLYDADCVLAVTHYGGPHWKANDGSIIKGTKVRAVDSLTAGSIPQLLLSAAPDGGTTGLLSSVTAVQRLDTVGGSAPATGCDAAHPTATAAVPYSAKYYFYSGGGIIP